MSVLVTIGVRAIVVLTALKMSLSVKERWSELKASIHKKRSRSPFFRKRTRKEKVLEFFKENLPIAARALSLGFWVLLLGSFIG